MRTVHTNHHRLSRRDFIKLAGFTVGSALLPAINCRATARPILSAAKAPSDAPNIILIIVDALRSDHVSANGYARQTTPNLDAWIANQGVTFRDATTTAAWTYPATAAMMTGMNPSSLGATWDNTVLPPDVVTLAEYLQAAGYYTAGFVAAGYVDSSKGFARGFNVYNDVAAQHPTSQQEVAKELNGYAMNWLNTWTSDPQPLFLFLYYFDPHTWYHPPTPYDTLYDPDYTGSLTPDVFRDAQDVVSGLIVPDARDVQHLLALYDGEITYWDAQLGQMFTFLQDQGLLDDALVIVTSDHGQAFGEHEKWIHANCLYEEVLRVPLLMRYPGVISPGRVVETPVQNMDLMPTILNWLDIPIPPDLHAVSLRALAEGQTNSLYRDIFSKIDGVTDPDIWHYWIAPREDLRSVQRDNWKLIHHVGNPGADELYQLNPASVYETENLIQDEPALARELRQAVFDWFGLHQTYLPFISR